MALPTYVKTIEARRVSGDTYECTCPEVSTYSETLSWDDLCRVVDENNIPNLIVHNSSRGEGEPERIKYRPDPRWRIHDMPRPAAARQPEYDARYAFFTRPND
jgi:hypothetical protein